MVINHCMMIPGIDVDYSYDHKKQHIADGTLREIEPYNDLMVTILIIVCLIILLIPIILLGSVSVNVLKTSCGSR